MQIFLSCFIVIWFISWFDCWFVSYFLSWSLIDFTADFSAELSADLSRHCNCLKTKDTVPRHSKSTKKGLAYNHIFWKGHTLHKASKNESPNLHYSQLRHQYQIIWSKLAENGIFWPNYCFGEPCRGWERKSILPSRVKTIQERLRVV